MKINYINAVLGSIWTISVSYLSWMYYDYYIREKKK